jgi:hypothetical protein
MSSVTADSRKVLGVINVNVDVKKTPAGKKVGRGENEGVSVNVARKKIATPKRTVKGDKRKGENDGITVAKKPVVTKEAAVQSESTATASMECQTDATFDGESLSWVMNTVDFRRLAETRLAVLEEMRTENDELFASKMELLDENERLRGVIRSLVKEVRKLSGEEVSEDEDAAEEDQQQEEAENAVPSEVEQQVEEAQEEDKEPIHESKDDAADNDQSEEKAKSDDKEEEAKQDSTE